MEKMRRKNIRLPSKIYQNSSIIFSLTICTWERLPLFANSIYADAVTDTLKAGLLAKKTKLYAYCLMPDHLHLLVSPKDVNLIDLINRWKSYSANLLRKIGLSSKCWQRSFYDHALRKEEEIETTAGYIVNNPVRAGIVNRWQEYGYSWHMWT
jgi:REP element-mobilizing transposase RayT